MTSDFKTNDYLWIKEIMQYPQTLYRRLDFFEDTSQVTLSHDPIERVIFQHKAKRAIRKIAQNRGHILLVGKPGTGKSMLAEMFKEILTKSLGDYLRPRKSILAYPGKDRNHIRFAYENPRKIDRLLAQMRESIDAISMRREEFSLADQIRSVRTVRIALLWAVLLSALSGLFFPAAFIATGIAGMGAIFMYMQESNCKVQERVQQSTAVDMRYDVKQIADMLPEVLYDPRESHELMARVSEPNSRSMKGGFRHDPYQSGNLQTPPHQRAYLGAHAQFPIIYIDELKTLIKAGYMPELLEIMQTKSYTLEGGRDSGSGAADRSENALKAENIIVACCNHDTLAYLQQEGDGAFLSRIEDRGEIVHMDSAVPETDETVRQVARYVKQEVVSLGKELRSAWREVLEKEGPAAVRKRSTHIFGRQLPANFQLHTREFTRNAVLEIVKELRCRASDGKLSSILRPINGIIKAAEFEAIYENAPLVGPEHVRRALAEHISLEGALSQDLRKQKKDLKKFISSMSDSIGYVVGLAVTHAPASGQMFGQPLPIHCQITAGGSDTVTAPGKIGEIAQAAARNVRASIKKVLHQIGAPYVGYEMHVEHIQAHGGVEGDSASVAMDLALISDFVRQPVNQKFGVTGSLTGDIVLPVGGVTEKLRCIMDIDLGMQGACIPWQNKHDVEPLLINATFEYIQKDEIPGIRIFRSPKRQDVFDIYFCKTKYNVYAILMGIDKAEVETRMAERSRRDITVMQKSAPAPRPAQPSATWEAA